MEKQHDAKSFKESFQKTLIKNGVSKEEAAIIQSSIFTFDDINSPNSLFAELKRKAINQELEKNQSKPR